MDREEKEKSIVSDRSLHFIRQGHCERVQKKCEVKYIARVIQHKETGTAEDNWETQCGSLPLGSIT